MSFLTRYARVVSYAILAVVTIYGVHEFLQGDLGEAAEFWRGKLPIVQLVVLLACIDVALEGVGWLWTYSRLGLRAWDAGGVGAFLSGRAGLLMPAQLGRLIRPDAMARLHRGPLRQCLMAEAVTFVLDAVSVAALVAGLAAFTLSPWAAIPASLFAIGAALFVSNRVASVLSGTKLGLPASFWWSWKTFATIVIEMVGWAANGIALFVIIKGLPGNPTCVDTMLFAAGSSVLGAGTGMPGGIGATEGLLGISLSIMNIPAAHFALAIGAFRLVTFWMWIPIGWVTLIALRRRSGALSVPVVAAGPGD